jgi:hypothetical protein
LRVLSIQLINLYSDCGRGSPIHIKPLNRTKAELDSFAKLNELIRSHKSYRSQTSLNSSTSLRKGVAVHSPWTSIDRRPPISASNLTSFPEFNEIEGGNKIMETVVENKATTSKEKIENIEEHVLTLEKYVVQLTQVILFK